jgi:hypothetical protein
MDDRTLVERQLGRPPTFRRVTCDVSCGGAVYPPMERTRCWATCAVLLLAVVTGCGGGSGSDVPEADESLAGPGADASGACAVVADFDGRRYVGTGVKVVPVPGKPIGEATVPACNDTPDAAAGDSDTMNVAAIPGVPPSVAVQSVSEPSIVLVREGQDPATYPAELTRLTQGPRCDPAHEPIVVSGVWRGIVGGDGGTELDLVPPYDLELSVSESSSPSYDRAELTVRVPADAGRPLSRADVEDVLWEAGTIEVTARCSDGAFVADQVEARPTGD